MQINPWTPVGFFHLFPFFSLRSFFFLLLPSCTFSCCCSFFLLVFQQQGWISNIGKGRFLVMRTLKSRHRLSAVIVEFHHSENKLNKHLPGMTSLQLSLSRGKGRNQMTCRDLLQPQVSVGGMEQVWLTPVPHDYDLICPMLTYLAVLQKSREHPDLA